MTGALQVPEPRAVHEVVTADGYPIALRRYGNPDGPRVVMSRGNCFAMDAYWPFWSRFADDFDVFVHDVRSHGWNPVGDPDMQTIPTLAQDFDAVSGAIDRRFGARRKVGVFHSLAALTALHAQATHEYAALVLFDPPMQLPGKAMSALEKLGAGMAAAARKRRDGRVRGPAVGEAGVCAPRGGPVSRRRPSTRACCRRSRRLRASGRTGALCAHDAASAADGDGYELGCPREHEARLWDSLYPFARTVDFAAIACPVKVIGSDPTVPNSSLPSMHMSELLLFDYDFVPLTTHLMQLEEPDACADLALEYLESQGFAGP